MDNNEILVRHDWSHEHGVWHYSIVDVIDSVVKTTNARNYWKVLKNRLKKRDNQIVLACNQLKLKSRDGKSYLTDVADAATVLAIARMVAADSIASLEAWIHENETKKPTTVTGSPVVHTKSFPQRENQDSEPRKNLFRNLLTELTKFRT